MEETEKEKIIRRVSSKSRRIARRARRVADESSSGSEFDDRGPSLAATTEKKTLGAKRIAQKGQNAAKLTTASCDDLRETLAILGISPSDVTYFHIWLAISFFQLQKSTFELLKMTQCLTQSETANKGVEPDADAEAKLASERQVQSSPPSASVTQQVDETAKSGNSLIPDEKACESEDADYISDYSIYSRQRKSINEFDLSLDESNADLSGRESGYLSGIDASFLSRGYASASGSPALSPQGMTFLRERSMSQRPVKFVKLPQNTEDEAGTDETSERRFPLTVLLPLRSADAAASDADVPDYLTSARLLSRYVVETKFVTAIFEMSRGGITALVDDVLNEFNLWFNEQVGLIGIACEVQWSVPEPFRDRAAEKRMKDALHFSLRQNNRRVLDLKFNTNTKLPLTLAPAITEENCLRDLKMNCFQGIYRRFYESLLPYQHSEAGELHRPYWALQQTNKRRSPPVPNPQQFVFGSNPTQLDVGSLVAVNLVALLIAN